MKAKQEGQIDASLDSQKNPQPEVINSQILSWAGPQRAVALELQPLDSLG